MKKSSVCKGNRKTQPIKQFNMKLSQGDEKWAIVYLIISFQILFTRLFKSIYCLVISATVFVNFIPLKLLVHVFMTDNHLKIVQFEINRHETCRKTSKKYVTKLRTLFEYSFYNYFTLALFVFKIVLKIIIRKFQLKYDVH